MLDPQKIRYCAQVWKGETCICTNTFDTHTKAAEWGKRRLKGEQKAVIHPLSEREQFSVIISAVLFRPETIIHHDLSVSKLCGICDLWMGENHIAIECLPCHEMYCGKEGESHGCGRVPE